MEMSTNKVQKNKSAKQDVLNDRARGNRDLIKLL